MKKIIALLLSVCLVTCCFAGCGKKESESYCNVDKHVKTLEKKMNNLDVEYLMDNVYVETLDSDNEAVQAAEFLGNALFEGAGTVAQTVGSFVMDLLESNDILTRKDLKNYAKDLKKGALKNYSYEVIDYQVLKDAATGEAGREIIHVDQKITVGGVSFNSDSYVEFVYIENEWKFHLITESDAMSAY